MNRFIDADALFDVMEKTEWYDNADRDEIAERLIMDAPTIDIVRCGECKHNYNTAINHGKMKPRCDFTDRVLTENDFCSRGEREGE